MAVPPYRIREVIRRRASIHPGINSSNEVTLIAANGHMAVETYTWDWLEPTEDVAARRKAVIDRLERELAGVCGSTHP